MSPGDMLFMYTDGVTEERNADRELFSEKRLVSVLASTTVDSVENAVRDTVAAVKDFRGDGSQEDDITALAVQFHGSSVHDPIAVFHIMARNDMSEVARVDQEFQKFAEEHGIPVEVGRRISILFDDLLSNVISGRRGAGILPVDHSGDGPDHWSVANVETLRGTAFPPQIGRIVSGIRVHELARPKIQDSQENCHEHAGLDVGTQLRVHVSQNAGGGEIVDRSRLDQGLGDGHEQC